MDNIFHIFQKFATKIETFLSKVIFSEFFENLPAWKGKTQENAGNFENLAYP